MSDDVPVSVTNLVKTFDLGPRRNRAFAAVNGISFHVRRGTLFGFLGPNGAGKTTTIKMMTGLIFSTSGHLEILGGVPTDRRVHRKLGYLPENPSFPDYLTGAELLRYYGRLLEVEAKLLDREVERTLSQVDLARGANLQIRKYSKGMVQRLGIAQALLGNPELVILDEPMSGLDPIGRRDIKDLILALRRQGKTVFFSTHIISDVEETCDDVAIIVNGRLARQGRVPDLIEGSARELEVTARGLPLDFPGTATPAGEFASIVVNGESELRPALERIWNANGVVTSVRARRYGLEEVFLEEVRKDPSRVSAGD